jgi:EAL domain-containing protein (putative c-di-GMP-specific phosphodiesterase class I)
LTASRSTSPSSRGIDSSAVNESIVRAVVAMANCLSMETVAEGTENMAELDVVKDCLCGSAQGFHFARPMPPNELSAWVEEFQSEETFSCDRIHRDKCRSCIQ